MSDKDFKLIFSSNLKRYLYEKDMPQAKLAELLGVGTTSVYNWASGLKIPRMDKVDAMCRIFGCNRSDLIEDHSGGPASAPVPSPMEKELLEHFRLLNDAGKEKAVSYVSDLADIDKYKKVSDSEALA